MSRSIFKGPFFNPNINNKIINLKKQANNSIKTTSKNTLILPNYIDKTLFVYNGKRYITRLITVRMVGHTLGSFIFTRKVYKYKKKHGTKNRTKKS